MVRCRGATCHLCGSQLPPPVGCLGTTSPGRPTPHSASPFRPMQSTPSHPQGQSAGERGVERRLAGADQCWKQGGRQAGRQRAGGRLQPTGRQHRVQGGKALVGCRGGKALLAYTAGYSPLQQLRDRTVPWHAPLHCARYARVRLAPPSRGRKQGQVGLPGCALFCSLAVAPLESTFQAWRELKSCLREKGPVLALPSCAASLLPSVNIKVSDKSLFIRCVGDEKSAVPQQLAPPVQA